METIDTTELLIARLAAAERELARRRVAAARAVGAVASAWWESPRECVAMLCRHEGIAAIVTDTLARVPAARWHTALPSLDACAIEALRAARARWAQQLVAAARGETVAVDEVPSPDGVVAAPRPPEVSTAPAEVPTVPAWSRQAPRRALDPAAVGARLDGWIARTFEGVHAPSTDDEPDAAPPRAWYELAPRDDGRWALWLVCAPARGVPPFVKVLSARVGAWQCALRRENLASHGARLDVTPSAESVSWTTGDDDDDRDLAEALAALCAAPLAADTPTVFRRDVEGPTQRLAGVVISRGARYAVLVPPTRHAGDGLIAIGGGWHLWEVEVPALVSEETAQRLGALGLTLGALVLSARWVLVPPVRWEVTADGGRVAAFEHGTAPVARVASGIARSDLTVFLRGEGATEVRALATTDCADLALEALSPGRYALEFTAADRSVLPARLAFAILPAPAWGRWPTATPAVRVGDRTLAPGDTHTVDLAQRDETVPVQILAPPSMSAVVRWQGLLSWSSDVLAADAMGVVPVEAVLARTRPLRDASPEALLVIDFGEWGAVTVRHVRTIDGALDDARASLRRALAMRAALLVEADAARARMWLRSVAHALGFAAQELASTLPAVALDDVSVDGVTARASRRAVMALVPAGANLRSRDEGTARRAVDALCATAGVARAFVTDSHRWWDLDALRSGAPPADSLDEAVDGDDELAGFLARYGAWR